MTKSTSLKASSKMKGANFLYRMGAWLYDCLLVITLEIVAITLAAGLIALLRLFGFASEFASTSETLMLHKLVSPLFIGYVFAVLFAFYGYFWTTKGQTIGMKRWGLKIISTTEKPLTFTQAAIRLATACFGAGNLLVLLDSNNRAFQDHFSNCQIIKIN
ncbi:MAG: RDD family protein [Vibrionaceae bacterium]